MCPKRAGRKSAGSADCPDSLEHLAPKLLKSPPSRARVNDPIVILSNTTVGHARSSFSRFVAEQNKQQLLLLAGTEVENTSKTNQRPLLELSKRTKSRPTQYAPRVEVKKSRPTL